MKKIIVFAALLTALAAGIISGLTVIKPQQRPADEDVAFQAILQDIADITVVPHTAGSPENYAVRDMIVNRAEALGLTAEMLSFELDVNDFIAGYMSDYNTGDDAYRKQMDDYILAEGYSSLEEMVHDQLNTNGADVLYLDNLLVKVNGTAPRGTAMFVSHYDHVKGAPGAADDALAVACMLRLMETMAQNPPENDVYFLYTDGEENGLLGAADFVRTQQQYADEIDVLFNFEARGNKGALLMFETSGNDYELVRQFSNNVPQPVTLSIATAIYGMMPNGTDYTEFKNAGYYGLNFAMIEGDETYHQPTDTLENLDKDTAWQYYQTMMALGEYFSNSDLSGIDNTQAALYFPLPLVGIVVIPGWLGYVIGFAPLILALGLIILTVRNREMKSGRRILRIVGMMFLGLTPTVVTMFFFAGSYMLSIPALLFLLADLALNAQRRAHIWVGLIVLLFATLISAILYSSLAFLVQIALKLPAATAILMVLQLIPIIFYSLKLLKRV